MAYLAPDLIGGLQYLAPDEPPGVAPPPTPASDASFNQSTIMRFAPINRHATMSNAALNMTANLL